MSKVKKRVIVIGGGFAGLGAARTLLSSDKTFDVTLLEGRSQLGGRIRSVPLEEESLDGQVIELGATLLHGEEGNSLYELACKLRIGTVKSTHRSPNQILYLSSDGAIVPTDTVDHSCQIVSDIFEELCVCSETNDWSYSLYPTDPRWTKVDSLKPNTYSEYILSRVESIISGNKPQTHSKADSRDLTLQMAEYWLRREDISNGSDKADPTSYHEFSFPLGDRNIPICGGYRKIVESLEADIPQEMIHFNKEVCNIDWSNSEVSVYCTDDTVYIGDHVIITVSLGVLKSTQLFSPPLPLRKQEAINKLGFGLVVKLGMKFDQSLIEDCYRKISFVWREEERHLLKSSYPWALHMYCIDRVGSSNWWMGWFTNQEAIQVQELPEDVLIEGMTKVLGLFLKRPVAPPTSLLTVSWGLEKFFKGSYSFNAVGSNRKDREELATPIDGVMPLQLLFAGEATHRTLYSTTNGAFDTGIREGQRLIQYYDTQ